MIANVYGMSRKRQQRLLNREIRRMNKILSEDNLWRGRFFARQAPKFACYEKYEDGSGGTLFVPIRFYDKLTLGWIEYWGDAGEWLPPFNHLWVTMNDFIVEDLKVWNDSVDPRTDTKDYRDIDNDFVVAHSKPAIPFPIKRCHL